MKPYVELNRLHRDPIFGKISGVCAGLAKHWDQPRWLIRVAAIACLLCLPMATAIAYVMAVVLIPSR